MNYIENNKENELPDHLFDYHDHKYIILGKHIFNSNDLDMGASDDEVTLSYENYMNYDEILYRFNFKKMFPQYSDLVNQEFKLIFQRHIM